MNRWKMRAVGALAVIALAVAGCQNQGTDELDSVDALPSVEQSMPSESDGMDNGSMEMSPSVEASPSDS